MKITSDTLRLYFSYEVRMAIRAILLTGLEFQLKTNWDGEDLEFKECCDVWSESLLDIRKLGMVVDDMNNQAGDMFGTEGWEHGLGIPT